MVKLWHDGARPLSLAAHGAAVHGVSRMGPACTPPTQRRHGYGAAVAAAATQAALELGAADVLYIDLDNPIPNAIYPSIG